MLISSANLLPDDIAAFLRLAVLCIISAAAAMWVSGWFQAVVATGVRRSGAQGAGPTDRQPAA